MKKLFAIVAMVMAILIGVVGCSFDGNELQQDEKIQLNCTVQYMIVGEQYLLISKTGDSLVDLVWHSEDQSVATVRGGLVAAKVAGECLIIASNSASTAACKVVVCNSLVSKEFDSSSVGFGIVRFNNINSAVSRGGSVVVMQGDYAEQLILPTKVEILAVGTVKVLSIYGKEFSLEGVSVQSSIIPQNGSSLVFAEDSMDIKKCSIAINTSLSADKLTGGSAVGIASGGNNLSMTNCQISNFAQGVNVSRFSGALDIVTNSFNNCRMGIVVNVRPDDNMLIDYQTVGTIRGNSFLGNFQDSMFLFGGERYDGNLDFHDFSEIITKPKEA